MVARRVGLLVAVVCAAGTVTPAAGAVQGREPARATSAKSVCRAVPARAGIRAGWWRSSRAGWWRSRWTRSSRRRCARPLEATDLPPAPGGPGLEGPVDPTPVEIGPEQLGHSVQVRAREYSLTLSRTVVGAGEVNVEFNTVYAEDPHDLGLRDSVGVGRPLFGETAAELSPPPRQAFELAAGDYVLFCAIPGHEALGMSARLSVR